MNKLTALVLVTVLSFSAFSVNAQQTVAVIYIETAMYNTNFGQSKLAALESDATFKSRLEKFNAVTNDLRAMQKDAQANGLTWSAEEKESFAREREGKIEERKLLGNQLESDRQSVLRDIQVQLSPHVEKLVPEIVKEKKIDVLLNNQAVYIVSDQYNYTQDLIDRLNTIVK